MSKIKNMLRAIDTLSAYILKSCLRVCTVLLLSVLIMLLHKPDGIEKTYLISKAIDMFISMIPLIAAEAVAAAVFIDLYAKKVLGKEDSKK